MEHGDSEYADHTWCWVVLGSDDRTLSGSQLVHHVISSSVHWCLVLCSFFIP